MMQRYAHLDPETIKATVERLAYRKESASATNSATQAEGSRVSAAKPLAPSPSPHYPSPWTAR